MLGGLLRFDDSGSAGVDTQRHWQPDELVSQCPLCRVPFTTMERKHHCRLCGRVMCKRCTDQKLNYTTYDLKDARGCEQCRRYLSEKLPILTRGCAFLRHCHGGKRHRVNIALTPDHASMRISLGASSLPSAKLLDHVAGAVQTLPLDQFRNVLDGQQTQTWREHHPGLFSCCFGGDDVRAQSDRSFSLVFGGATRQTTLDLLADTVHVKNGFLDALNEFLTRRNSPQGKVFHAIHESRVQKARERGERAKVEAKQRYSSTADRTRAKYFS